MLKNRIHRFFKFSFAIAPTEFRLVQLFFLLFLIQGVFTGVIATISDALFVSSLDVQTLPRYLPWLYIGTAFVTIFVTWLYAKLLPHLSRIKLIIGNSLIMATVFLGFRFLLMFNYSIFTLLLFYVWSVGISIFVVTLSYSFLGDYFDIQKARKVYAYIASGGSIGAFISATIILALLPFTSVANMIYVSSILLVLCAYIANVIFKSAIPRKTLLADRQGRSISLRKQIVSNTYIINIFIITIIIVAFAVIADYQMTINARMVYSGKELAHFFARLTGAIGLTAAVIQLFLGGWLQLRFGVIKNLLLTPVLLMIAAIFSILYPGILFSAGIYYIYSVLFKSLNVNSIEMLFLILPHRLRIYSQAFNRGVLIPVSKALLGLVLLVIIYLNLELVVYKIILIMISIFWLLGIFILSPLYTKKLSDTIRQNVFLTDEDTIAFDTLSEIAGLKDSRRILIDLLKTSSVQGQLLILELLPENTLRKLTPNIIKLLPSADEKILPEIINIIGKYGTSDDVRFLIGFMAYPNLAVQASSISSTCELLGEEAVSPLISNYLQDADDSIRQTAIVSYYNYCGASGKKIAVPIIDDLLNKDKLMAIKIIGSLNDDNYLQALKDLLHDEDVAIKIQAIHATQQYQNPQLIEQLIELYNTSIPLRATIQNAIYKFGSGSSKRLIKLYKKQDLKESTRVFILRALGKIGGEDSLDILLSTISSRKSPQLLISACQAICSVALAHNTSSLIPLKLTKVIHDFYHDLECLKTCYRQLGTAPLPIKSLFVDTLKFYSSILIILMGLQYGIAALTEVANIFIYHDQPLSGETWELLEVVLPRKDFLQLKKLFLPPLHTLSFTDAVPTQQSIEMLLSLDAWVVMITRYYLRKVPIISKTKGEGETKEQEQAFFSNLNTVMLLKKMEFFKNIPAGFLIGIIDIVHEKIFYPGESIVTEGDAGDSMYLICNGNVKVVKNGKEVASLSEGECIGEMALIDSMPRSATIVAINHVTLLKIFSDDFNEMLLEYPEISRNLLMILSKRLRDAIAPLF